MCDAGLAGVELRACKKKMQPVSNQWRPGDTPEQLAMYGGTAVRAWSGTWAARLSSPGPVPLGPASALLSMGFDWLSILLVLVGVRHVEMSRQVCHIKVTPDATLTKSKQLIKVRHMLRT